MAKKSFLSFMMGPVRRAEKAITPAYQDLLRQHAASMPNWTPEDVASINMRYKSNSHVITYTGDDVLDKEYGTPDTELSPAIRSFMLKRSGM